MSWIRSHLYPHEVEELERFQRHAPDFNAKANTLITEIERMVSGYAMYWRLAHTHEEQDKLLSDEGLTIAHEGITVTRQILPHGSTIRSLGYHAGAKALDVEFQTGKVYRYYDVPEEVVKSLSPTRTAASIQESVKGKYKYALIR